jgi:predicted PurR-regulated permease PerM
MTHLESPQSHLEVFRRNAGAILAVVALVALGLWILSFVIEVLLLFFIGILFGVFLYTVSHWVSQHTALSRKIALLFILLLLLGLIVAAIWLLQPSFSDQFEQLTEQLPTSLRQIENILNRTEVGQEILEQAPPIDEWMFGSSELFNQLADFFSSTINVIAILFIVLFIGIYLAIEPRLYIEGFVRLIPATRRERMREVLAQITHTLQWWLLSRGIAMLAVGTLASIGLWLIGVPLVLTLGMIAGLFELIPYIGPFLGVIPALLIALSVGADNALYVMLLYFSIQQAESYLITPLIERRTVKLPPALTVLMQGSC